MSEYRLELLNKLAQPVLGLTLETNEGSSRLIKPPFPPALALAKFWRVTIGPIKKNFIYFDQILVGLTSILVEITYFVYGSAYVISNRLIENVNIYYDTYMRSFFFFSIFSGNNGYQVLVFERNGIRSRD